MNGKNKRGGNVSRTYGRIRRLWLSSVCRAVVAKNGSKQIHLLRILNSLTQQQKLQDHSNTIRLKGMHEVCRHEEERLVFMFKRMILVLSARAPPICWIDGKKKTKKQRPPSGFQSRKPTGTSMRISGYYLAHKRLKCLWSGISAESYPNVFFDC